MPTTVQLELPDALLLTGANPDAVASRMKFFAALKCFELGELTSGQAARMCGLPRVEFLTEASRHGVPVVDLSGEELAAEFARE